MAEAVRGRAAARAGKREETPGEATKENLQRQMDETRESISQTVTDIKDSVVEQYNSVKESVADTLDWREQFRSHPWVWCFGALSVGFVLGNSVINAFKDTQQDDSLLSHLSALGDHFADELSKQGMSILAPALTGTILVPVLASKIKELTGVDITHLATQLTSQDNSSANTGGKGRKKKAGAKKQGKKKKKKS